MTPSQITRADNKLLAVKMEIKAFYNNVLTEKKMALFKPTAIRHFKSLYDDIQEIKQELESNKTDFQSYLDQLELFKELSKRLIIKVRIKLL